MARVVREIAFSVFDLFRNPSHWVGPAPLGLVPVLFAADFPGRCPGLAYRRPFGPDETRNNRSCFGFDAQRANNSVSLPDRIECSTPQRGRPYVSPGQRPGTRCRKRFGYRLLPSATPSGFGGCCCFCHRELRGHGGLVSWRIFSAASVASGIPKGFQKVAGGRREAAASGMQEPQRAMVPKGSQIDVRPRRGRRFDNAIVSGGIRCAQTTGYHLRSRRDSVASTRCDFVRRNAPEGTAEGSRRSSRSGALRNARA